MKMRSLIYHAILNLTALVLLTPLTCSADMPDITAQELKAMLDSGQKMLLVNPLSDIEFNEGHIPGSVNIPLHTIMRSDSLPQNKDSLIVTYCLSNQ